MNKNLARFAAASLLVASLSACSIPGLSGTDEARPAPQSQSQPAQNQSQPPTANATSGQVATASSTETTVAILGNRYTCADITGNDKPCDGPTQEAFGLYGGSLDGFVNSGRLGILSTEAYSYQDAAYAGLRACTYGLNESAGYVNFLQSDPVLHLSGTQLLPVFFEAHRNLCP